MLKISYPIKLKNMYLEFVQQPKLSIYRITFYTRTVLFKLSILYLGILVNFYFSDHLSHGSGNEVQSGEIAANHENYDLAHSSGNLFNYLSLCYEKLKCI